MFNGEQRKTRIIAVEGMDFAGKGEIIKKIASSLNKYGYSSKVVSLSDAVNQNIFRTVFDLGSEVKESKDVYSRNKFQRMQIHTSIQNNVTTIFNEHTKAEEEGIDYLIFDRYLHSSFVYNTDDDFFSNEELLDYAKHLIITFGGLNFKINPDFCYYVFADEDTIVSRSLVVRSQPETNINDIRRKLDENTVLGYKERMKKYTDTFKFLEDRCWFTTSMVLDTSGNNPYTTLIIDQLIKQTTTHLHISNISHEE